MTEYDRDHVTTCRVNYNSVTPHINSCVDGVLGEKEIKTSPSEPNLVDEPRTIKSHENGGQSQTVDKVTPGRTKVITKLFSSDEVYSSEPEIGTLLPTHPGRVIQNNSEHKEPQEQQRHHHGQYGTYHP